MNVFGVMRFGSNSRQFECDDNFLQFYLKGKFCAVKRDRFEVNVYDLGYLRYHRNIIVKSI